MVAAFPVFPPVIPPVTEGADHAYVVPAGIIPLVPLTGVIPNPTPLQLTVVMVLMTAVGFTVTVTENTGPLHIPVTGVTK